MFAIHFTIETWACIFISMYRFLSLFIGWRKHSRADHPISYMDTLVKPESESIEAALRRR